MILFAFARKQTLMNVLIKGNGYTDKECNYVKYVSVSCEYVSIQMEGICSYGANYLCLE